VLEDDLVTSSYFLKFMNEALEFYKDEKKVWHISGWNYPIFDEQKCSTFLWKKMNCWGWATWEDRWKFFEKKPQKLIKELNKVEIKEFNLDGYENNWNQVVNNLRGKINTWAVFWHTTIFKNNGLCLNPETSFVKNIGHDGSGVHCGNNGNKDVEILNYCKEIFFENRLQESDFHLNLTIKYIKLKRKPFIVRVINKISRMFLKRDVIA
jgi:hypothetical protein